MGTRTAADHPGSLQDLTGPKYIVCDGINGCLDTDLHAAALRALEVPRASCRDFAAGYSWKVCTRQFLDNLAINH